MDDNIISAYAVMKHNERIWNNACKTIKDLINYKNAFLYLENPDGNICMIKVGTKILADDGTVFEITENTEMKTAEIATIY